jgi:hypothetical protein
LNTEPDHLKKRKRERKHKQGLLQNKYAAQTPLLTMPILNRTLRVTMKLSREIHPWPWSSRGWTVSLLLPSQEGSVGLNSQTQKQAQTILT